MMTASSNRHSGRVLILNLVHVSERLVEVPAQTQCCSCVGNSSHPSMSRHLPDLSSQNFDLLRRTVVVLMSLDDLFRSSTIERLIKVESFLSLTHHAAEVEAEHDDPHSMPLASCPINRIRRHRLGTSP